MSGDGFGMVARAFCTSISFSFDSLPRLKLSLELKPFRVLMSRPLKRQRWQNLLHEGRTTLQGLRTIVKKLGTERVGRGTLASANRLGLEKVGHVEIIERLEGPPFRWEMASPTSY